MKTSACRTGQGRSNEWLSSTETQNEGHGRLEPAPLFKAIVCS